MALSEKARDRATRLFRYLAEFQRLRNPVRRLVAEHEAHISCEQIPASEHVRHVWGDAPPAAPDDALVVEYVSVESCPPPPEELRPWLHSGWRNPRLPCKAHATHPEDDDLAFAELAQLGALFDRWMLVRNKWAEINAPLGG